MRATIALPDLPFLAELTALRRDIHAHPELAFDENRTAEVVARELERYGLEVYRGIARTDAVSHGHVEQLFDGGRNVDGAAGSMLTDEFGVDGNQAAGRGFVSRDSVAACLGN